MNTDPSAQDLLMAELAEQAETIRKLTRENAGLLGRVHELETEKRDLLEAMESKSLPPSKE